MPSYSCYWKLTEEILPVEHYIQEQKNNLGDTYHTAPILSNNSIKKFPLPKNQLEIYKKNHNSLSDYDKQGLRLYKSGSGGGNGNAEEMNSNLLKGAAAPEHHANTFLHIQKSLDNVMKPVKEKHVVYRGVADHTRSGVGLTNKLQNLKAGTIFKNRAYTSTSLDPNIARNFAEHDSMNHPMKSSDMPSSFNLSKSTASENDTKINQENVFLRAAHRNGSENFSHYLGKANRLNGPNHTMQHITKIHINPGTKAHYMDSMYHSNTKKDQDHLTQHAEEYGSEKEILLNKNTKFKVLGHSVHKDFYGPNSHLHVLHLETLPED